MRKQAADEMASSVSAALTAVEGRSTAGLRRVRQAFSKALKDEDPELVLGVALRLAEMGQPYRWVGYELVHHHRPALRALDAPMLEQLGQGMADWPDTDTFAPFLSGVAWREGQIGDEVIHRWAQSEDRWWRRAALVSTVALNIRARGGRGDTPRTLTVCELLVDDRDDMVVKAMSWALRSLVVYDPEAVRAFLERHDGALAARVKREVRNKLDTGLKYPRRAGSG